MGPLGSLGGTRSASKDASAEPRPPRSRAGKAEDPAKPARRGGFFRGGSEDRPPRAGRERPARSRREPRERAGGRRSFLAGPLRFLAVLLGFAAMVGFAWVLARITLVPSPASESLTHNNVHPGESLRLYFNQPGFRDTVRQVGGNLLLGVPFGVLLPVLAPKTRGLIRVPLLSAVVMFLVELVQGTMITGRAFDIDDVILNTAGALLGYLLLGRRLGRAVHPPKRRRSWFARAYRADPEPEPDARY
ncbi:VanZ family protein [Streptomyces sp. NPDC001941]|uniref:VanZ family protein n=1 Tax=Streptomyces sp. NPDC001941 TaxID=3154659 RepID=UPI00332CB68B